MLKLFQTTLVGNNTEKTKEPGKLTSDAKKIYENKYGNIEVDFSQNMKKLSTIISFGKYISKCKMG